MYQEEREIMPFGDDKTLETKKWGKGTVNVRMWQVILARV